MSSGKTELANQALLLVGASLVTDVETDPGQEGEVLRASYDFILRACLKRQPWQFAQKRAALSRLATTPVFGYTHKYALPGDFVSIVDTLPINYSYAIEKNELYTDADTMSILYVSSEPLLNPGLMPPAFAMFFVTSLAAHIGYTLCENVSRLEEIKGDVKTRLIEASVENATMLRENHGDTDGMWMESGQYQLYYPARSAWGPGFERG